MSRSRSRRCGRSVTASRTWPRRRSGCGSPGDCCRARVDLGRRGRPPVARGRCGAMTDRSAHPLGGLRRHRHTGGAGRQRRRGRTDGGGADRSRHLRRAAGGAGRRRADRPRGGARDGAVLLAAPPERAPAGVRGRPRGLRPGRGDGAGPRRPDRSAATGAGQAGRARGAGVGGGGPGLRRVQPVGGPPAHRRRAGGRRSRQGPQGGLRPVPGRRRPGARAPGTRSTSAGVSTWCTARAGWR